MTGKSKNWEGAGQINLILLSVFTFVFASLAIAQTEKSQTVAKNRIAVIDTSIFSDRKQGIKILVQAENSYNIEYFEIHSLTERIEKLEKEISYLIEQNASIKEKYLESQKLKAELERAEELKKAEIKRKYSMIVFPVVVKIKEKLNEFSRLKGYALVIDKAETSILVENETTDVTLEFIKFCNDAFDKEKLQ